MQEALAFLVQKGHDPFGRGFAVGSLKKNIETNNKTKEHRKFVIEWLVNQNILDIPSAYQWWESVTESNDRASLDLCFAINITNGIDPSEHTWWFDMLFDRSPRPSKMPVFSTKRLEQMFPDMFAFEWAWDLFSRALQLNPLSFAQTMVALYFSTDLWEKQFKHFNMTDVFAALITVRQSIDWPNSDAETRIGCKKAARVLGAVSSFLPPSDDTTAAVTAAEQAIPVIQSMSVTTLGDLCKILLKFGPCMNDALQALGFDTSQVDVTSKDQGSSSHLVSLRPGQSSFLARIWYLLHVSSDMDWVDNYVKALEIIDDCMMEEPENVIGMREFKSFAENIMCPAVWVTDSMFCVDLHNFLRCIYWFQPEDLFVEWSSTNRTKHPVEEEQWVYEMSRWCMSRVLDQEGFCLKIPGFSRTNFNASVLKMPLMGQRKVPLNRYSVSDL